MERKREETRFKMKIILGPKEENFDDPADPVSADSLSQIFSADHRAAVNMQQVHERSCDLFRPVRCWCLMTVCMTGRVIAAEYELWSRDHGD